MNIHDDVRAFHKLFDLGYDTRPGFPEIEIEERRLRLLQEEYGELFEAVRHKGLSDIAGEAVDLIYVTVGLLLEYGIDIRPIWDAVHKANMAKAGGERRADGKILKPEGWKPADLKGLIQEQIDE